MIISHKYKFIFIKTNKTAGTSIEIGLSKFCGPKDIITPLTPEDEEVRKKLGYRGPQNYHASCCKYGFTDIKNYILKGKKKQIFYNHISAKEVISIIGQKKWDDYFTFCFERNPVDRFISFYYWRNRDNRFKSVNEFINSSLPNVLKERGCGLYSENDKILVDYIGKYENLQESLSYLEKKLMLPEPIILPFTKVGYRPTNIDPESFLNAAEMDWIRTFFAKEIKLFDYIV